MPKPPTQPSKRQARRKSAMKNPIVLAAIYGSSVLAAALVGYVILNFGPVKSSAKKSQDVESSPIELDPNYDYEADKRRHRSSESTKSTPSNLRQNESEPATTQWLANSDRRKVPVALLAPETLAEMAFQPIGLAISQRNYPLADRLYQQVLDDPQLSVAFAFSDLTLHAHNLKKFWQQAEAGVNQVASGTRLSVNGESVQCTQKLPDSIKLKQPLGGEKTFSLRPDLMETELAVALYLLSADAPDNAAIDQFRRYDFPGNSKLLALLIEAQKADTLRSFTDLNYTPARIIDVPVNFENPPRTDQVEAKVNDKLVRVAASTKREFLWTSQKPWRNVRIQSDGIVRFEINNQRKSYPWEMRDEGIYVQANVARHFIFSLDENQKLIGQKFDTTNGKQLDSVIGQPSK